MAATVIAISAFVAGTLTGATLAIGLALWGLTRGWLEIDQFDREDRP